MVEIYFDTATFDDIEKDKKIKTEAQLSLIGGTMGLLTGFSILSGVEIIYFIFRFFYSVYDNLSFSLSGFSPPERLGGVFAGLGTTNPDSTLVFNVFNPSISLSKSCILSMLASIIVHILLEYS